MSLNMTYAMNQNKVKRYGKLFGTIDFVINKDLNETIIKQRYKDTIIGEFHISGKEYTVTLAELDRIIETAENAKRVFFKSYGMGRY